MADVQIEIRGIETIEASLKLLGISLPDYMSNAAMQAGAEIYSVEGLKSYPPEGPANKEPTPYYIRGRGMQYKSGNNGKSEKYGTKWTREKIPYGAKIGNNASYAKYLAGDKQVEWAGLVGWRILTEVAREKIGRTKQIFEQWLEKAIKAAGLK